MPDTAFSWRGLREHIRKFLWVYLLVIALSLLVTRLLWIVTQPRLSNAQRVNICLVDSYSDSEPLEALAPGILARVRADYPGIRQVQFESLMYNDQIYTSNMLLLTRLSVGECDAFLASPLAMDALVASGALEPLDDWLADGWLSEYGLEPYVVTTEDEETGASTTWTAGLRLDSLDILAQLGAFNNEEACLCVCANGDNVQATRKALEYLMTDLTEASHAGTNAA